MRTSFSARLSASPRSPVARRAHRERRPVRRELGPRPELPDPAVAQLGQVAQRLPGLAEREVETSPGRPQESHRPHPVVAPEVDRQYLPRGVDLPAIEPDLAQDRAGHRLGERHRQLAVEAECEGGVGLGVVELAHLPAGHGSAGARRRERPGQVPCSRQGDRIVVVALRALELPSPRQRAERQERERADGEVLAQEQTVRQRPVGELHGHRGPAPEVELAPREDGQLHAHELGWDPVDDPGATDCPHPLAQRPIGRTGEHRCEREDLEGGGERDVLGAELVELLVDDVHQLIVSPGGDQDLAHAERDAALEHRVGGEPPRPVERVGRGRIVGLGLGGAEREQDHGAQLR